MGWPSRFVSVTSEEAEARRHTLDRFILVGFGSSFLVPLLAASVWRGYRISRRFFRHDHAYEPLHDDDIDLAVTGSTPATARSSSPLRKKQGLTEAGRFRLQTVFWWLQGPLMIRRWNGGSREVWLGAVLWGGWLAGLAVWAAGDDYLHVAKRLGGVAVSQLPALYVLATRETNLFAALFGTSYESLNRWHRVLGRLVISLVALHIALYLNFLVRKGLLGARLREIMILCGVVAGVLLVSVWWSSWAWVRAYSYRLFFFIHVGTFLAVPPLLYVHTFSALPAGPVALLAWVMIVVDVLVRQVRTLEVESMVEVLPDTRLVRVTSRVEPSRLSFFQRAPGGHVFLSVPVPSRPGRFFEPRSLQFEVLFNPFTVASVDEGHSTITLVARQLHGPVTNQLAHLAATTTPTTTTPLHILGPYGDFAMNHARLLDPRKVDRVLLVAGGVGATFTVPIYKLLRTKSMPRDFVWVVRREGELAWAPTLRDDPNVHLFVTRPGPTGTSPSKDVTYGRPDLGKMVSSVFRRGRGDRVAVILCGPDAIVHDVRVAVSPWVEQGRQVHWHNENFRW